MKIRVLDVRGNILTVRNGSGSSFCILMPEIVFRGFKSVFGENNIKDKHFDLVTRNGKLFIAKDAELNELAHVLADKNVSQVHEVTAEAVVACGSCINEEHKGDFFEVSSLFNITYED